jgi:Kef-type K+ transport system membrane component KefB
MHTLFYIGLILIAGLLMGKIITYIKLPEVTGYLLAGVIIGPSIFGLIPAEAAHEFGIISEVALGFIAYSIGSEFNFHHMKQLGGGIILITIFEALGAVILVDLSMIFIFNQPLSFSIVLGAIAAATAPAATLMVIRQYKAKGPLVDTLLPIVAMDDAVCIIIFGISITIAKSLTTIGVQISLGKMIITPFLEIILALILGIGFGIILSIIANKANGPDQLLCITIAVLFLAVGLSVELDVSPLLVCMSIGAAVTNTVPNNKRVLSIIDRFTPPVFIAFFTIAGVELNIAVLKEVGLIGAAYILIRMIGKIFGAGLGARLANMPAVVQKYLGFTLVPQAGVAIGLAMVAETTLPAPHGSKIRTIILAATVVYELIGPLMTKIAIFKAGEVNNYKDIHSAEANLNC